jgi:hypothetical protein
MQLKADLIGSRRVVRPGDVEHELVIEAVERAMTADLLSPRHVGIMVASAPHARQRVFERHACFENRIDPFRRSRSMGRGPERSERAVDGRDGLLR